MKRLVSGLLIAAGAAVLAVGVLAVVELLLAPPASRRRKALELQNMADLRPVEELIVPIGPSKAARHFSIRRTKSEVGYVYWILEGFGKYKCYLLCDTWDEAVEQARLRLAQSHQALVADVAGVI